MSESAEPLAPPPSRHPGSRVVTRQPNIVRSVTTLREDVIATANRVRREDIAFAPADASRGEPATSATFANTLVTMVYRSGHTLFADVAFGLGTSSALEARLHVPDLSLTGAAVASTGSGEQDVRLTLALSDIWPMGEAHRVYVQARRTSGAEATTVRVLRAWQR